MSELIMPPAWVSDGLCGQVDADLFHPERTDSDGTRIAKRVCNGDPRRGTTPCPVLDTCRDWALETGQLWGVYGGLSARERQKLRVGRAA